MSAAPPSAVAAPATQDAPENSVLRARRLGLYARHEPVVLLRRDSPVCRSEGLSPHAQVLLCAGGREVYAILDQIDGDIIAPDEAGLSEAAWTLLGVAPGDPIVARHAPPLASLASLRRRIYGMRLDQEALDGIVADVAASRYTDLHLAAFLTATSALPFDEAETLGLTRAMTAVGDRLSWSAPIVMDKHCVGGLPGNRTTPIVVAIVAAAGLIMPKTSSRAITSPAGTADTMETLAPVDLSAERLRQVVEAEGGCVAWGGAMRLSPADDIFIRVERVLDVDTEGQLIASVLSKKIAAGATHVVIDLPVGPTAKVRNEEAALRLAQRFGYVADQCGLKIVCVTTDGAQPVGRGIGPALEALDILAVLQTVPDDLYEAARIDGLGHIAIWWRIILPLCRPVTAICAVFTFIGTWNDFLGPLIYLHSDESATLAVALNGFKNQYGGLEDVHLLMALSVLTMIPCIVLFIAAQKTFVEGLARGAVKG